MKPNSVHKFDDLDSANIFTFAIKESGFKEVARGKDGGIFYSNGRHTLFVCIDHLRSIASK